MKKRFLSLTLAAAMVMSLAGCRSAEPAATTAAPASEATTAAPADGEKKEGASEAETASAGDFKIGIITGTASQGDEEITQANKKNMVTWLLPLPILITSPQRQKP